MNLKLRAWWDDLTISLYVYRLRSVILQNGVKKISIPSKGLSHYENQSRIQAQGASSQGGPLESWLDVTIHFNTNVTGFRITMNTYLGCVCVSVSRKH